MKTNSDNNGNGFIQSIQSIKYYKVEIERVKERIRYLQEDPIASKSLITMDKFHQNTRQSSPHKNMIELVEHYEAKLCKLNYEIAQIEEYVNEKLAIQQSSVIKLYYLDNLSINEIAECLSYSASHIKRIKKQALKCLQ